MQYKQKIDNVYEQFKQKIESNKALDNNEFLHGEYAYECAEILADTDHVGANLSKILGDTRIEPYINKNFDDLSLDEQNIARNSNNFERMKQEFFDSETKFQQYIDVFDGNLKMARFHTSPKLDPFDLENADHNGKITVSESFIKKILYAKKHGVNNITVCAGISHFEDGIQSFNLPKGNNRQKYLEMIDQFVFQTITDKNDESLTIELGNETNETIINTTGNGIINQASQEINPKEYADFYKEIAVILKAKYPNLRLSIAGVSLADPGWIKNTVEAISDDSLIDEISIHPYRSSADNIWAPHIEHVSRDINAEFNEIFNGRNSDEVQYSEVENFLTKFGSEHGADLVIGEMQIGYGINEKGETTISSEKAHLLMADILNKSANNGRKTYIWPRTGIPF